MNQSSVHEWESAGVKSFNGKYRNFNEERKKRRKERRKEGRKTKLQEEATEPQRKKFSLNKGIF